MKLSFKHNLGLYDQVGRIMLGLVLIFIGILSTPNISSISRTLLLILGIFFLAEGFAKY